MATDRPIPICKKHDVRLSVYYPDTDEFGCPFCNEKITREEYDVLDSKRWRLIKELSEEVGG